MGFFLSGCAKPSLSGSIEDYSARLARVLEQDAPSSFKTDPPKFPTRRELIRQIPNIDIDLFDFLKLGDCELQSVVAERNSSLGKFAADSVKLKQDIDFILLVGSCIDSIEDPDLQETLGEALAHKQRHLSSVLWNAMIAGPEYNELWTNKRITYPHVTESELQGALSTLQTQAEIVLTQQQLETFDAEEFEQALSVLRSGEAAALLVSWIAVKDQLSVATKIVDGRVDRRPLCFDGMRSQNAEFFRNVVFEKFIAGIQRDVAVLNQRYYEVVQPLQALEAMFVKIETEAYRDYRNTRDERFIHGIDSVKAHVDAIQPLMMQCGFLSDSGAVDRNE